MLKSAFTTLAVGCGEGESRGGERGPGKCVSSLLTGCSTGGEDCLQDPWTGAHAVTSQHNSWGLIEGRTWRLIQQAAEQLPFENTFENLDKMDKVLGKHKWPKLTVLFVVCQLLSCFLLFATLMDHSPSGSSVHGILQARILEWVAISSFRRIEPRSPALQADSLPSEPPGKPQTD